MAELRADLVDTASIASLNEFGRSAGLPLILTLRQPQDGGKWTGSSEQRRAFFEGALEGPWTWWDIEDDQRLPDLEERWIALGRKLVVSFHEFDGVSSTWAERLRAARAPHVVTKAAVFPRNSAEFDAFVSTALELPPADHVVLAMGEIGFPSRVLAARFGSLWTYVPPLGSQVAPGQVDAQTLQTRFRFREQTASSPVFGIVGNPVSHSKSPLIHNAGFARLGLEGTYLPFLADDLAVFLKTSNRLGVKGLSCTIPFKEEVILHLKESSTAVKATGACNTLWRNARGEWNGDNTDAPGFLAPLLKRFDGEIDGKRVTVIGTGGAARGIVWALKQAGAKVVILGRTPDKTQAVAFDLGVEWAPLGPESRLVVEEHSDVIVQTTSVGMGPQQHLDPLSWYEFSGSELAYDIVYSPRWTPFLTRAKDAGCEVLFGEDMLVGQALGQFRRFTGQDYPLAALPLHHSKS